ncbi:DUF4384 domain-containing protein [Deinococcus hopiensis]|uniref:DUF4384 domain-containing protein n=1 Tax=Deinococcus hopiensis KR-140 TaxID=695939 RepID=A0A1W1UXP1_9DEIO|nr:DUF4384 domain-containing protein [Deinococcus hopiensis]SMB85875.1 protein of unknown function [Deinococcus hopiensis KR-140]
MKKFTPYITFLALLPLGHATAAPQLSAQSIIVNPTPTGLNVNIRTNRTVNSQQIPSYAPGDHLEFYTRANKDAYVYLFNVDAQDQVTLLSSNGLRAQGNLLKANTSQRFPEKGEASTFLLTLPQGLNRLLAVASLVPLDFRPLTTQTSAQGEMTPVNVKGQAGLGQALTVALRSVPPQNWTTATTQYTIARRALSGLPELDVKALKTQVNFRQNARLSEVFAAYADHLRAEGYLVTQSQYRQGAAQGVFVRQGAQLRQVMLEVAQRDQTFFVKLMRQK